MTHKEARQRKKKEEQEKISTRLRQLYDESGLTAWEISKITGVKRNTLISWFNGYRCPKKATAEMVEAKIANYFNKGKEYIDKQACRNYFIDKVYDVFTKVDKSKQGKAIVDIYDSLPTVSKK